MTRSTSPQTNVLPHDLVVELTQKRLKHRKLFESKKTNKQIGVTVKIRVGFGFVAMACIILWFVAASLPVEANNTLNGSDVTAYLPNIPALEVAFQANLSQVIGQNYSGYIAEMAQNPAAWDPSTSGTIDYPYPPCQDQLWIVDYLGNPYPCGAKCTFLNDFARMVAVPYMSGLLRFYEKYPDQNVMESSPISVNANQGYYGWFISDVAGLHTVWFTVEDFYGQVTRSNDVKFRVVIENCSPMANC